ncbi:hypothetical protein AR457_40105 [Streptomyces agglomeratus]|uniref:hypothetical protein n=1 Tax=Streptomyces agglomeratus TaxID=285458 RepID=UPI0008528441|nr:hypothetical protein [Streptomyces agglomeratus]OEJ22094.1 hypothetical protein AR457_40105 [Streptomyces agglomeratus]OEJ36931.1 hypothetical protein BGK70_00760 [Streptomyces agglomeratus]
MRPTTQPLPFDADREWWADVLREAVPLQYAARAALARRPSSGAARAAAEAQLQIRERARGGWLRWGVLSAGWLRPAGVLREAGVFDPGQNAVGRWFCRMVWGRRAPLCIWTLAGLEPPRPLQVGRAAVFTVTAFAALGPVTSVLPTSARLLAAGALGAAVAAGLPAAIRHRTRRRVRVVKDVETYAAVYFRLLAGEQQLRMLAGRSGRSKLTRVSAVLPRLLCDTAGLVPLAAGDPEARELLRGYEQSVALLVNQAVAVERQEDAVESAIRDDHAFAEPTGPALPDGLLPRACLEELGQGLHHAREVLGGADADARSGEIHE